jgi:hypothetical protein
VEKPQVLKKILTHPLRHTWTEGNHTHTPAVDGKSFHNGLTKRGDLYIKPSYILIIFNDPSHNAECKHGNNQFKFKVKKKKKKKKSTIWPWP